MKKTLIFSILLTVPTLTLAGGMGHLSYTDMLDRAVSGFTSSEDPNSIRAAREATGSENENYLRHSFDMIPSSYWNQYLDLSDPNGTVELEEYLGETERSVYNAGEDAAREDERQDRARNKAMRLRSTYGY